MNVALSTARFLSQGEERLSPLSLTSEDKIQGSQGGIEGDKGADPLRLTQTEPDDILNVVDGHRLDLVLVAPVVDPDLMLQEDPGVEDVWPMAMGAQTAALWILDRRVRAGLKEVAHQSGSPSRSMVA